MASSFVEIQYVKFIIFKKCQTDKNAVDNQVQVHHGKKKMVFFFHFIQIDPSCPKTQIKLIAMGDPKSVYYFKANDGNLRFFRSFKDFRVSSTFRCYNL